MGIGSFLASVHDSDSEKQTSCPKIESLKGTDHLIASKNAAILSEIDGEIVIAILQQPLSERAHVRRLVWMLNGNGLALIPDEMARLSHIAKGRPIRENIRPPTDIRASIALGHVSFAPGLPFRVVAMPVAHPSLGRAGSGL